MLRVFIMDLLSVVAYYDAYLCRALESEGMSVTLGAITYHFDRDCFKRLGIRNRPGLLDCVGRFKLSKLARQVFKVIEMCLNLLALAVRFTFKRPDIIHVQYLPLLERNIPLELCLLRYCRFLGSSLVATVHDVVPHDRLAAGGQQFKRAFEMMDALICHSEAARMQVSVQFSIPWERVRVIPHGPLFFDPQQTDSRAVARARCGADGDECIVLCQGMVRPYKGIEFLLDAWAELQRSAVRAKLIIAGRGESDLLDSIRKKVHTLGIEDSVRLCFEFLSTEAMISCYRAADIAVYPYKAITTSGALMTGIAQAKAIVATGLPAFRELLEHGKNALLCDYGDRAGLASCLQRLIEDATLRAKLASEAAVLCPGEQMWKEIASQTRDCYLSVTQLKTETSRNPVAAL